MAFEMTYDARNRKALDQLASNTKKAAYKWYDYCISKKANILITETKRDLATQRQYVNKGVSTTLTSYHLVGQALDFVPIKGVSTNYEGYGAAVIKDIIKYAKSIGFSWGGDWKSFVDKPHLEFKYRGYGTDTYNKIVTKPTDKKKVATPAKVTPTPGASIGDKTVREIQEFIELQYEAKFKVDGQYGPLTKKGLIKGYQKEINRQFLTRLDEDGIWGKNTKDAAREIRKGAQGNLTYIIQSILYCLGYDPNGVDGIFGEGTKTAIEKFQKAKKLDVDGVAGPNTIAALFS